MKLAKTLTNITLCLLACSVFIGCRPVSKVKRTLALNDIHIQAAIAEDKGDYQTAYDLWTNYVERRPQSVLAEHRLGLVEIELGLYEQAIGHLRIAHDLKPGNIEYINALATALLKAGQKDALMALLLETTDEGPAGSGQLRLARFAQQAGLMDEAHQALLRSIIENNGQSPIPYIEMANFANTIGDSNAEIKNLRYALWFDRSDPVILNRLTNLGMIAGPSLALIPQE